MALSTLSPTTSPHLSSPQLTFTGPPANPPAKSLIKVMGNDLRWIADQVARIEREFGEAMNITVFRDLKFGEVLNRLNVGSTLWC